MKKSFVRNNLLKSLNLKMKHNRTVLISICVFLVLIVSFAGIKLTQIYKDSKEKDITANIDIDENSTENTADITVENDQNEESENIVLDNKDAFVLPKEGIRPYAVMIDNEGTNCLPQGGLHKAQIIYEIIVEGGVTRYMPVFWHDPEDIKDEANLSADSDKKDSENEENDLLIGPVRSSRHYFLDYALEHDAIYVHFGWSPQAQRDISRLKVNNINGISNGGEIFWDITNNPNNWQDSYTSINKITEYIKKVKYRTETDAKHVFNYNEEVVELSEGEDAVNVMIKYNHTYTSEYMYDPETRMYNRMRNNKPHIERATGEQLTAMNIIIQYNNNYTIKGDPEGRQEVETTGSGEGWYITCGKAIKIKWSKSSRTEPTIYTDESGNTITLNPGQTWIQVVSPYAKVEITNSLAENP